LNESCLKESVAFETRTAYSNWSLLNITSDKSSPNPTNLNVARSHSA
jgi:hypothetical protein